MLDLSDRASWRSRTWRSDFALDAARCSLPQEGRRARYETQRSHACALLDGLVLHYRARRQRCERRSKPRYQHLYEEVGVASQMQDGTCTRYPGSGFPVSKPELSALFAPAGPSQFPRLRDQMLRNFLKGRRCTSSLTAPLHLARGQVNADQIRITVLTPASSYGCRPTMTRCPGNCQCANSLIVSPSVSGVRTSRRFSDRRQAVTPPGPCASMRVL